LVPPKKAVPINHVEVEKKWNVTKLDSPAHRCRKQTSVMEVYHHTSSLKKNFTTQMTPPEHYPSVRWRSSDAEVL
jgi:hypothetical protein